MSIAGPTCGAEVGEPVRAEKDGEAAVRIFVYAHPGAHEVAAQRRRRDLQGEPLPFDGVIVTDEVLFLNAEDLPPGLRGIGDEGGSVLFGGNRKAVVVLWQINLG